MLACVVFGYLCSRSFPLHRRLFLILTPRVRIITSRFLFPWYHRFLFYIFRIASRSRLVVLAVRWGWSLNKHMDNVTNQHLVSWNNRVFVVEMKSYCRCGIGGMRVVLDFPQAFIEPFPFVGLPISVLVLFIRKKVLGCKECSERIKQKLKSELKSHNEMEVETNLFFHILMYIRV